MGDCERFHDGLIAEPVNALSSVAYIAAGAYVWQRNRPAGAALMAVGAGSLAYHGPGRTLARVLHDAAIIVVVAVLVISAPRIVRGTRAHPMVRVVAIAAFLVAIPFQVFGRTGGAWCLPDSPLQPHAAWHILTAVALGTALAFSTARVSPTSSGAHPPRPTNREPASR